jgi:hypothetical protein
MNFSFFSEALIFLCYFLCIKAKKVNGGNAFMEEAMILKHLTKIGKVALTEF